MAIRIALLQIQAPTLWLAGVLWFKGLMEAVNMNYNGEVVFYFLYPQRTIASEKRKGSSSSLSINLPLLQRWSPWRLANSTLRRVYKYDMYTEKILRRHNISVLLGPALPYHYGSIPSFSWIWDFQHRYLPEMFSATEYQERENLFLTTARLSTRIVVKSESVQKDLQNFLPQYAHKVRRIKFNSFFKPSIYEADLDCVVKRYSLPDKFFYLPNQFWKHKNHETVIRAVKLLKDRGKKVCVVCSGFYYDSREPWHFSKILRLISEAGIRDQIIYLGGIPYQDVGVLMRQCICVMNPSLFEGFGMSVSEAGMLGKQMLISDIAAHREHSFPKMTFFEPLNIEELAEKMSMIWDISHPGPDTELEEKAKNSYLKRLRETADSFLSVVKEVVE